MTEPTRHARDTHHREAGNVGGAHDPVHLEVDVQPARGESTEPSNRRSKRRMPLSLEAMRPGWVYWLLVLGIVLVSAAIRSTALHGTLLADDWDHYAISQGIYPIKLPAWDLFRFVPDTNEARQALADAGRLPWWHAENLHLAVFRPLSSLLVYADLVWLDGHHHPWQMHLHSFLWWFVVLVATAALYRRLLPVPIAALALLLYAVDEAHVYPVAWIANRSELISLGFTTLALWAHLTAVAAPHPLRWRVAAAVLTGLGLLAGEHALAPLCYFGAFELSQSQTKWCTRLLRLLPYVVIAGLYMTCRSLLGYGVAGSAFYIDPLAEPARYLSTAATRIPLLAGDLVLGLCAEWWYWGLPWNLDTPALRSVLPRSWLTIKAMQDVQLVLGWAALVGLAASLVWLRRSRHFERLRLLWAGLLGATLSLVPMAGTASMSRLTAVPALAFDASVACLLGWLVRRAMAQGTPRARVRYIAALLPIVLIHFARSVDFSMNGSTYLTNTSHLEFGWTTSPDFGSRGVQGRHVFILSAHDMATQFFLPYTLHAAGLPTPRSCHLLSAAAMNDHVLTRVAPNVLDVQYPEPITDAPFTPTVYRRAGMGFFVGQTFHNALFEVEVKSVRGVEPRHLRFTFRAPLDDPGYLFLYPTEDGIAPLDLPQLGESIRLDAPAWPQ